MKLLLICLLMCSAGFADGMGKIAGRVVDENGEAVIGAAVQILETKQGVSVLNPDGSFVILGVLPGTYTVKTSSIGYVTDIQSNTQVQTGEKTIILIVLGLEKMSGGYDPEYHDMPGSPEYERANKPDSLGRVRMICGTDPPAQYGVLCGDLFGAHGESIESVIVQIGDSVYAPDLDSHGRFRIGRIRPGTYPLQIEAVDYTLLQVDTVLIEAHRDTRVSLRLQKN